MTRGTVKREGSGVTRVQHLTSLNQATIWGGVGGGAGKGYTVHILHISLNSFMIVFGLKNITDRGVRSSGSLSSTGWYIVTGISGQRTVGPI